MVCQITDPETLVLRVEHPVEKWTGSRVLGFNNNVAVRLLASKFAEVGLVVERDPLQETGLQTGLLAGLSDDEKEQMLKNFAVTD